MNKYKALAPVTLRDCKVRLTPEQHANRRHVVKPVDGEEGVFEPIVEVSFKAGEVVETDAVIPKALHVKLEPITDSAAAVSRSEDSGEGEASDAGKRRQRNSGK